MSKTRTKGITIAVGSNVGQVTSINGYGIKADTVDETELGDAVKQLRAVIAERKPVRIGVNWDPELHDDIENLVIEQLDEEDPTACSIVFPAPASATRSFAAWVTDYEFQGIEPGGIVRSEIELTPTGE